MHNLLVGGTFDENNGKPSSIISQMSQALKGYSTMNGGNIDTLKSIDFTKINTLIWMPNVANNEEKILPAIKKANPKLFLVSSKRVVEKDYKESDVIGRLLATHSNLGIMISLNEDERYNFKILDPLGNIWADTPDIPELCDKLNKRTDFLNTNPRWASERIGPVKPNWTIEPDFINIIRKLGDVFSQYVNAVNPNRFLGNASTRCSYGFPGVRQDNRIFVTRRNVDKTTLSAEDFVEVERIRGNYSPDKVGYYGDAKPSVDTPVQLLLFNEFPEVTYMIHGHVYVKDAPYTNWHDCRKPETSKLPCGSTLEFGHISEIFPYYCSQHDNYVVNLLGHGFIAMASSLDFFNTLKFKGRPFPEGL